MIQKTVVLLILTAVLTSGIRAENNTSRTSIHHHNHTSTWFTSSFDPNARLVVPYEEYEGLDEANSTDPLVLFLRRSEKHLVDSMSSTMDSQMLSQVQQANLSSGCMQGLLLFADSVKQYEVWAVKMLDSWSKMPEGLVSGAINSFGNYDSCLSVEAVDSGELVFTGQYCAVERGIEAPASYDPEYLARELPKARLIRKALSDASPVEISLSLKMANTRMAMCLPSTCSHADARKIVNLAAKKMDVKMSLKFCQTKEEISDPDLTQVVLIFVMFGLSVFSVSCTLFDGLTRRSDCEEDMEHFVSSSRSFSHRLILSCSMFRSYQWLSRTKLSDDRQAFVYGIRMLAIIWVFYAYSYAIQNFTSLGNSVNGREIVKNWLFQLCLNGTLATESFIFISGFMSTFCFMRYLDHHSFWRATGLMLVVRLWRTMPVVLVAVAAAITSPLLSSGPVWREMMVPASDKCRHNWLWTALFVSNFANEKPEDSCLIHMWFNALDTQLCLLTPILTILLIRWPKGGLFLLVSGIAFSITGTGVQMVSQSLPPVPVFFVNSIHFIETLKAYIFDLYFLPMQHISAFVIGSGTAAFLHSYPKISIKLWVTLLGWIISFGVKLVLLFVIYAWNTGRTPSTGVSVLYGSTCRTIWALTHCWDFIAAYTGHAGYLKTLFSWPPIIPLSRMTFTAHTFGPMLMLVTSASNRAPYFFTHLKMFQRFTSCLPINYAAAFLTCLMIEGPLALTSKILVRHLTRTRTETTVTHSLESIRKSPASSESVELTDSSARLGKPSLIRRLSRLPKIKPSKSIESHQITRIA